MEEQKVNIKDFLYGFIFGIVVSFAIVVVLKLLGTF